MLETSFPSLYECEDVRDMHCGELCKQRFVRFRPNPPDHELASLFQDIIRAKSDGRRNVHTCIVE